MSLEGRNAVMDVRSGSGEVRPARVTVEGLNLGEGVVRRDVMSVGERKSWM